MHLSVSCDELMKSFVGHISFVGWHPACQQLRGWQIYKLEEENYFKKEFLRISSKVTPFP